MKKYYLFYFLFFLLPVISITAFCNSFFNHPTAQSEQFLGVASTTYQRTILPEVSSTYDLGSFNNTWRNIYVSGTAQIATLVIGAGGCTGCGGGGTDIVVSSTYGTNNVATVTSSLGWWMKSPAYASSTLLVDGAVIFRQTVSTTGLTVNQGGFISNASSSVGAGLQVAGNLSASSTLTVAGAATLASTLGVTGLTTLTGGVIATASSSFSSTVTFQGGTIKLALGNGDYTAVNNTANGTGFNNPQLNLVGSGKSGPIYLDATEFGLGSGSSGQQTFIYSAGTAALKIDSTQNLYPNTNNLQDFGVSSTIKLWRYGNFSGGLNIVNGTTNTVTTTIDASQILFAKQSGFNLGKFYVDSSGNVSASGTLLISATSTLQNTIVHGLTKNRRAVGAGNDTANCNDDIIAKTAITIGGDTETLPTCPAGKELVIKDESNTAGTKTITMAGAPVGAGDGTGNINRDAGTVGFYSDGTNWWIEYTK